LPAARMTTARSERDMIGKVILRCLDSVWQEM
jgi:hypothetical protein